MALSLEKQVIFLGRWPVVVQRGLISDTQLPLGELYSLGVAGDKGCSKSGRHPRRRPVILKNSALSPSRSPARARQNPPWPLSLALPLLPLALQPLPAQCQPFLPPLLTPLLVLLSRKKKKMFLLDQKGTRERSPRSQCRGGPARGLEKTEGRAGCAWRGRHSAPRPSLRPRTWGLAGRSTVVEPDPQGHPRCLGLGRGLLMAAPCPGWVTTEVSNSTLTGVGGC